MVMADNNRFETAIKPLLCEDSLPVINWLKEHNLLRREMKCSHCSKLMKWMRHSKAKDGYVWKCSYKHCDKYRCTISLRTTSFFAKSNMSFPKWLHAMYLWSERYSARTACKSLNVCEKTMIDIYSCFREVCALHFEAHPIRVGGPGIVIMTGDSIFSPKPKKRKDFIPPPPIWVLGIVDTSTSPAIGYMEIVEKRELSDYLSILETVVLPGSMIYGSGWKALRNEEGLTYIPSSSLDASPSSNGVDQESVSVIQTVDAYLNVHRNRMKQMRGFKREFLKSYLHEYMWHERYSDTPFENICKHIALQYSA